MAAGDIETFQRNCIWFNRIEGESRTLGSSFESEAEDAKVGRSAAVARQVEHTVRTAEGPSTHSSVHDLHPRELIGR